MQGFDLETRLLELSGPEKRFTVGLIETVNKRAEIFVNDVMACSLTFPNEPTDIVGVQYRFNGVGAIKNTWFDKMEGKVIHF